jgi:hypothetical protein
MVPIIELTAAQRILARAYLRAGYTACFFDPEDGRVLPGYADWSLAYVLDELEGRAGCSKKARSQPVAPHRRAPCPGPADM